MNFQTALRKDPSIVLPSQPGKYRDLPIIAVDMRGNTLDENGELGTLKELVETLPLHPSSYIVGLNSARILTVFQEKYQKGSGWDSTTQRRERVPYALPIRPGFTTGIVDIIPRSCGWRCGSHKTLDPCFHFIDPYLFYGNEKTIIDVFGTTDGVPVQAVLKWGQLLRRFCWEASLSVSSGAGGIAAQFLRDRKFYPDARRKVPKSINDRLRTKLPGNYCLVTVSTGTDHRYHGIYLDQRRAHHYHARTTPLPNANSLFACGDHRRLKTASLDPTRFLNPDFYGVVYGEFIRPTVPGQFLPPRFGRRASGKRFVYSSEWPFLESVGVRCRNLSAAWGSRERDQGLLRYSEWAEAQLDKYDNGAWLKPILLATYGLLAYNSDRTRPDVLYAKEKLHTQSDTWRVGSLLLHGFLRDNRQSQQMESRITNVLHRGLIEAATRAESLAYANYLQDLGYRILMIHVDGLIIEQNDELPDPPMPEPWRHKTYLTDIEFIDNQSFTSLEMTRLPGRIIRDRKMVSSVVPRVTPGKFLPGIPDER